jgi:hypothetical protein
MNFTDAITEAVESIIVSVCYAWILMFMRNRLPKQDTVRTSTCHCRTSSLIHLSGFKFPSQYISQNSSRLGQRLSHPPKHWNFETLLRHYCVTSGSRTDLRIPNWRKFNSARLSSSVGLESLSPFHIQRSTAFWKTRNSESLKPRNSSPSGPRRRRSFRKLSVARLSQGHGASSPLIWNSFCRRNFKDGVSDVAFHCRCICCWMLTTNLKNESCPKGQNLTQGALALTTRYWRLWRDQSMSKQHVTCRMP